ncbi:MAG: HD domain-containing phosphohydrolase [Bacteroidota bacterium]|nr:hypothetical protein [Candidatus Kapabacteria bacterium]MDW8271079.1 HD domain-containing phosphohydrolase [Bacteroidota bacterium]
MDAFSVLLIPGAQESTLFEQILVHSTPNVHVVIVSEQQEIERLCSSGGPACIMLDWATEIVNPELFPRQLRRDVDETNTYLIALVYQYDQLYTAYRVGYNYVITIEYTRATYYTVTSILHLLERLWQSTKNYHQLQLELQAVTTKAEHWINVLERLMYQRIPEAPLVASFARESALWIAYRLSQLSPSFSVDREQLEIAARLYAVGRLHLPDADLSKPVTRDGVPSSIGNATVPERAAQVLDPLVEYPLARLFLLTMYENYDGTGFPNRLQGWHIPIGARILRVVVDYAEMVFRDGMSSSQALSCIEQSWHRLYDQRVVVLLDEYVTTTSTEFHSGNYLPIRIEDLVPGMTLGRDVITAAGHKLAPAGMTLNAAQIERIITHHALDPVVGMVYVVRQ